MKAVRKIFKALYFVYFYTVFAVALSLCYPFIYFLIRNPKNYPAVHNIRKWGCRVVLLITGIWYKKIELYKLQKEQVYIFCANHSSMLDIVVPLAVFDRYHHYLGKKELGDIPLFGIFFKYMDIPVDRSSNNGLFNAYIRAENDLDKGISLVIFPEGTTTLKAPKLHNFKLGAFKMAIKKKIPVVPVTFPDNWRLMHYDKKWNAQPGIARMVIHPPLWPGENEEEVEEMKKMVYDTIDSTIKKYNKI